MIRIYYNWKAHRIFSISVLIQIKTIVYTVKQGSALARLNMFINQEFSSAKELL